MPLASCPRCSTMFNKTKNLVCPKCEQDEQEDYEKVREVLEQMPNLTAEEIAEEADVACDCVLRMLDSGLVQTIRVNESVKCGRCGSAAISISKRLCQACLEKLNAELAMQQAKVKLPPKKEAQLGEVMMNVRKTIEKKRL